jgi:hypothetical protein
VKQRTTACALKVKGRVVQRATASGPFGRATCIFELPAADAAAAR